MDHHDDWTQWHHDDPDPGHLGDQQPPGYGDDHDLGGHDLGRYDDPHADYHHDPDVTHDDGLNQGPDLVHEGDDLGSDQPADFPHQPEHLDLAHEHDQPVGTEHLVGADPDLPADAHSAWHEGYFPPALDLDTRPEPADGYPWTDPDVLGEAVEDPGPATGGAAPAGDLFAYAGIQPPPPGADPWVELLASDDPATSALARFWQPDW